MPDEEGQIAPGAIQEKEGFVDKVEGPSRIKEGEGSRGHYVIWGGQITLKGFKYPFRTITGYNSSAKVKALLDKAIAGSYVKLIMKEDRGYMNVNDVVPAVQRQEIPRAAEAKIETVREENRPTGKRFSQEDVNSILLQVAVKAAAMYLKRDSSKKFAEDTQEYLNFVDIIEDRLHVPYTPHGTISVKSEIKVPESPVESSKIQVPVFSDDAEKELIGEISKQTGASEKQLIVEVEEKVKEFSGMLSREGAVHLVANEHGVKIPVKPIEKKQAKLAG